MENHYHIIDHSSSILVVEQTRGEELSDKITSIASFKPGVNGRSVIKMYESTPFAESYLEQLN